MSSFEQYMYRAIELAKIAAQEDEVPVGALIVRDGAIIGEGYNKREQLQNPLAHAEVRAIEQASSYLNSWRLIDCDLYVTLEPCPMCLGAAINARIGRIIFGAFDPKAGACGSVLDFAGHVKLNHSIEVVSGVLGKECGMLLSDFFRNKRSRSLKTL